MYFYFYLDDSLSTLIINEQTIYSGYDVGYQSNFQILGPHEVNLNNEIIFYLFSYKGCIWGINGYIEIDGYRFYTNNSLLISIDCPNSEICNPNHGTLDTSTNIIYYGYEGKDKEITHYKFTFRVPENRNKLKEKSNKYEIQYKAKDLSFIVYQGQNKEINTINFFESKLTNIYTKSYNEYDNIYIEFLSNFKGRWNIKNGNEITNRSYHSEINYIYTPENNINECYISQFKFYSYKTDSHEISSSNGIISFYICGKNCQNCIFNSSNSIGISCNICKEGYVFVNNNYEKCIDKNTLIEKYYEFDNQNYYSCYESCLTCKLKGDLNNHNCTSCSSSNYFIKKSESNLNCVNNCPIEYPLKNGKECLNFCKDNNLFYKDGNCINECLLFRKKIINFKEENECINECNDLIIEGDLNECVEECPNNKPYISYDGKYCLNECKDNYPYYQNNKCTNYCYNNYYHIINDYFCISDCPNSYSFIIEDGNICVNNCNDKYKYYNNNKKYCLDDCYIKNLIPDKKGKICYKNCEENNINDNKVELNGECVNKCLPLMKIINSKCVSLCDDINDNKLYCNISKQQAINEILSIKNTLLFKQLDKTIFGYGFNIQVYESDNILNELIDTSIINVSQCEKILRNKYNIKDNEKLTIIKIDSYKEETKENYNIEYHFNYNGKLLDNSYCNEIKYDVSFPIKENLNISNSSYLYNHYGIDIYNKNDDYFNNICKILNDNHDILLKEREKYYYQNETLCMDNCLYNKLDYINRKNYCICNNNYYKGKNIKNIFENFFYKQGYENLIIFRCYKILKLSNKLFYNIGFIFLFSIIILQTIFLVCSIKYKKIISKIFRENNKKNYEKIRFSSLFQINTKNEKKFISFPYRLALKYDKRKFNKIFLHIIKRKMPFLNMFYNFKNFQLFSLELNIELTSLVFLFTINTLLYNDRMISHKYIIGNKIDYLFLIINSFRVYFVIFIFNLIISSFNYSKYFDILFSENDYPLIYQPLIEKSFKKFKFRVIIYFIIQYIFCILIWYYVTIFCFIYNNNQIDWFIEGWFTFILLILFTLFISFIICLIRKLSLKLHSMKLYNISLFINNIRVF